MSLGNITYLQSVKWVFTFIAKLWYAENQQKRRQWKTRQDNARQDKKSQLPDKKVFPGFENTVYNCMV